MNYRILVSASFAFLLLCSATNGQVGRRLQDAATGAAERAATRQTEKRTEQAVDKAIDGVLDGNKDNKQNQQQQNQQQQQQQQAPDPANSSGSANTTPAPQDAVKAAELAYAKSDFVPGDEIIFDDPMDREKLGEFPSQWDLLHGNAEVANFNGIKGIFMESPGTELTPLMKNMKNYLPEDFTLEFDFWVNNYLEDNKIHQRYILHFRDEAHNRLMNFYFGGQDNIRWEYKTPEGDNRYGDLPFKDEKVNSWNHLSVSFNKRAFKAYINGVRVANIPNMAAPKNLSIDRESWQDHRPAITNIRLSKGAVPLYDRMMSDGKFITYGIIFDVGKSTIKPESMSEINRIVTLMKENPDLKFSVEGHTDSTGAAASNQSLSEARSQAVVDKLAENGIAKDRLKAAGKGQSSPIADNGTDEGRAKNRRVEFVKI